MVQPEFAETGASTAKLNRTGAKTAPFMVDLKGAATPDFEHMLQVVGLKD